jgi:putative FmdB family regulatory protein
MPIYEYRCQSCGHRFEKLVKMSAPTPECPECGADEAKKLVSASGFILKGGGWYKDHYGLKSSPAGSKGEGSAGGESSSGKSTTDGGGKASSSSASTSASE